MASLAHGIIIEIEYQVLCKEISYSLMTKSRCKKLMPIVQNVMVLMVTNCHSNYFLTPCFAFDQFGSLNAFNYYVILFDNIFILNCIKIKGIRVDFNVCL